MYENYRINDDLLRIIVANTRTPQYIKGDLQAHLAALQVAEAELRRIAGRRRTCPDREAAARTRDGDLLWQPAGPAGSPRPPGREPPGRALGPSGYLPPARERAARAPGHPARHLAAVPAQGRADVRDTGPVAVHGTSFPSTADSPA